MIYVYYMQFFKAIFSKQQKQTLPEILLVDKSKGITSYDVIRRIKKKYGKLKIGHAGTLDPLATGLLIVGVGEGTKRMAEFLKLPKTYEVEILLGVRTDTGDLEGKIIESAICRHPTSSGQSPTSSRRRPMSTVYVRKVLDGMVGEIELPVPVYSAVKQKGVPLYKRARRGERVTPPKKKMEIRRISLREMRRENNKTVLEVVMDVGSGTYVRSIAEEIGNRLGVPATVKELRRTKIGNFNVKNAKRLDD